MYSVLSKTWTENYTIEEYSVEKQKNPYHDSELWWCTDNEEFCINNGPNHLNFDAEIKIHMLDEAKKLPRNYGIIDCGAHVGDGTIPIAQALEKSGRGDIVVYAIDPSPYKIKYIREMVERNNLSNVKIISVGLSDNDNGIYTHVVNPKLGKNTGGIHWDHVNNERVHKNKEKIIFKKLDTLVANKQIIHPIGYIHFDVEDMEPQAIKGGIELFKRYKPILSAETFGKKDKIDKILEILAPLGYKNYGNKRHNTIFKV